MTQWTEWTACDRPCGIGNRRRTRECQGDDLDACNAKHRNEDENCNVHNCTGTFYYCLRNRTTLRFDFLHSFMVYAQISAF